MFVYYLVWLYIFLISGGFSHSKEIAEEVEHREHHERDKRFLPLLGVVLSVASLGVAIVDTILQNTKSESKPVVTVVIKEDRQVREAAEKLGSAMRIADGVYEVRGTRNTINCSPEFCNKLGRLGEAAFSLVCSSEFCHCDTGERAWKKSCGVGTVFNPIHRICDWPRNVPGC